LLLGLLLPNLSAYAFGSSGSTIQPRDAIQLEQEVLLDASDHLSMDNILQLGNELEWQWVAQQPLNLGFNTSVVWLRTRIPSVSTGDHYLLEVAYPLLDQVDLFFVADGNVVNAVHTGDQEDFTQRPFLHRNFIVPIPASPDTDLQLYLRIHSEGAVEVPLRLWQRDQFWQQEQRTLLLKGAFTGTLLVMILYNLFVYLVVRDQSYLYYIGYGVFILLFQVSMDGLAYQYLWPGLKQWHQHSVVLFVCFAVAFRCMFTIRFLDLSRRMPAANWLLALIIFLALMLASLSTLLPYNLSVRLTASLVLPSTVFCLLIGLWLLIKGVAAARYFVLGWLVYFVGAFLFALTKMGWLPVNNLTEYLLQLGITLELVLFSMALADNLNLERKRKLKAQRQAIQNLERYRSLYENAAEGIYQSDMQGNLIAANPAMASMLGYVNSQELLHAYGQGQITDFLAEADFRSIARDIMEQGRVHHYEVKGFRRDGQVVWMSVSAKVISGLEWGVDSIVEGFVFDITQRKRNEEQLTFLSRHDPLTGLANRREFETRLQLALETVRQQSEQHTLLLLDMDQFRLVNDTCGHMAGDEMLRQVTAVLRQLTRGGDVLARLGGDEFAILLSKCSQADALAVAEKIRGQIQGMRFEWDGRSFNLAVSIGLVHLTAAMELVKDVMNLADAACLAAKNSGRNRVHVYDPEDIQLAHHQTQMEWAARIAEALEKNLFQLYVQPIVPVSAEPQDGMSYEVLLRLRYEDKLVYPAAFMPAAERYALMPQLDRWVVRTLFQWLAKNPRKQEAIADVAINLSGLTLGDNEFSAFLREQFELYQIDPHKICFEITETIAVTNLTSTVRFIEEFRALGCSFSLDDFGTGFSSYGYLKSLPIDYLKIDGAFIRDMVNNDVDRAMVESINRIGHVMGKKTIAEFVENASIQEALQRIGVDYGQGYGIAQPFAIDHIKI